ncbi:MAG TPA: fatty acyl-AMP ligase [Candidatus Saccharimonadia bacterium]|nr:fatty acyl-AMP ligase [Candidatus Saccharimonadia bacterium]
MRPESTVVAEKDAEPLDDIETLMDLVQHHAMKHGEDRALTFLADGVNEESFLTYALLDREARAVAAWLQSKGLTGQRALLLFPSGLEFVTALLGCIYAGVIAVPVNPPRLNRKAYRLRAVVEDSQAAVALTTARMLDRIQPVLAEAGMASLHLAAVDARPANMESLWQRPIVDGDSLAFLQYTSGSTSHPKGVMVNHHNLLANHRMMQEAFGQTQATRIVTWLPLFHDMGLIGNVLQALYLGTECLIIPPEVFLMKPVCWLSAISRHRATFSGAPNFAYELCIQKVTEEQRQHLDLSGWDTAFAGAEPVRHTTMERFAAAFAPCGFRKEALYPCYGLAEASLFVSGAGKFAGAHSASFSTQELERHRVLEVKDDAVTPSRTLVSCGHSWGRQVIEIADSETGEQCKPGTVGEIWVAGPHVACGYWNHGPPSAHSFGAKLAGAESQRFLRTGDLGFFHEGGLYISGRIKDLIIIAGRNHDPGDIEHTVCACHPAIRPAGCAAFQVEVGEDARLVIAVELERTSGVGRECDDESSGVSSVANASSVVRSIRQAVASLHDLAIHEVVLLRPAALPKTSSGKIQRHAARTAWLENTLKTWEKRK